MQNKVLNLVKGIAAFGVICIHFPFPSSFGTIISKLADLAVPLFFLISGFYSYQNTDEKIKKKIRKTLMLCVGASLFYLAYGCLSSPTPFLQLRYQLVNINHLIRFFLLNDTYLFGSAHLWFVYALLYVYLIYWFVHKFIKKINWAPTLLGLFILDIILMRMPFYTWQLSANFLFRAIPYFFMGLYFAENKEKAKKLSAWLLGFIVLGGAIGNTLAGFYPQATVFNLGLPFYAIGIFLLCLRLESVELSDRLTKVGQKYAMYIYIFHIFWGKEILKYFPQVPILNYLLPFMIVLCCIVTGMVFQKCFKKERN